VIADPKALRHIFHTSGYNFGKPKDALKMTELVFGKGLSWVQGSWFATVLRPQVSEGVIQVKRTNVSGRS
jgi:hypothetical protein